MGEEARRRVSLSWNGSFFLLGGLLHWLFYRAYRHHAYGGASDRGFIDSPLTSVTICALGGLFVMLFLRDLLRHLALPSQAGRTRFLIRAGAYGVSATLASLQTFLALATFYLVYFLRGTAPTSPQAPGLITQFVLGFIDIETYGLDPMTYSLPFGLVFGLLVGLAMMRMEKWVQSESAYIGRPWQASSVSLLMGILGVLSSFFIMPSALLSLLAIILGIRALWFGDAGGRKRGIAIAGLVLGTVGLLTMVLWLGAAFSVFSLLR